MEKESYLENKEYTFQILNSQFTFGVENPIVSGYYRLLYEYFRGNELECALIHIAAGLFQLDHNALMEDVEVQMTGWIKAYKEGWFDGMIEDVELLEADIAKIESMITLRFDEVELVED